MKYEINPAAGIPTEGKAPLPFIANSATASEGMSFSGRIDRGSSIWNGLMRGGIWSCRLQVTADREIHVGLNL
jgi:hypothetical protein